MSRRGVWQLTKLTVNYCAHSGSSRGVRCVALRRAAFATPALTRLCSEFISSDLELFRSSNPQMAVEAALRPGRHPHALAEYGALRPPRVGPLSACADAATPPAAQPTATCGRWT